MLNGRIYRAAFLPLLLALAIAGLSLTGRAAPLGSDLAPDAFEGARAFATLEALARRFPERRPGSAGDRGLAGYVASALRDLGVSGRGGFAVSTHTLRAQTIDGKRTLTTVIARRAGTSAGPPIVIVAHRDAAGRGARAELSGTVALLELARVLAASETHHPIVLASTSGGSGGDAGSAELAAHPSELASQASGPAHGASTPIDAALVLGDLAGARATGPAVSSLSAAPGGAPALLQSTVAQAVAQQTGLGGGEPGTLAQLARLAFPLAGGEQGPFDAHGLPAVLVGVGGEREPPAGEPVSAARLQALGRGALSALYALDSAPEIAALPGGAPETGLPLQHGKAIPAWALRLLVATLLLPALLAIVDGLARLRRRRVRVGRWVAWTLACALPFFACALFAVVLGALGAIPAPTPPVSPTALPFDRTALEGVLACVLALILAWLAWPAGMRRLSLPVRPRGEGPALAVLLVLGGVAVVAWLCNPATALLLVPALNLWLAFAGSSSGRSANAAGATPRALALVALGVAPVALLVAFYAVQFHLGAGDVAHAALLLLAGGRVGVVGAALWSIAGGCTAAAVLVALTPATASARDERGGPGELDEWLGEREPITIRGPLSYAGPGSLGGTESALWR